MGAVKILFRYLNGTRFLGIQLFVDTPLTLHGFSDADWAGNSNDRTSASAFLIFRGVNPISRSSTKQRIIAYSSIEAKYRVITLAATKLQWVK